MSQFPPFYALGQHKALTLPKGWDVVTIGGIVLRARARVTGFDLNLKVDPHNSKSANPAHPTLHGLDSMQGDVRLVVMDQDEMDAVDDALPLLCPPVNLEPVSLDHAQLRSIIRLLGKLDVIIKGLSPWAPSSTIAHGWEMNLHCLHWPAAQKLKGRSTTPLKPKTYNRARGLAAQEQAKNPAPTDSPSWGAPPAR